MEAILNRIKSQSTSKLPNQKQSALLLNAVEAVILDQGESSCPLAYFGVLMSILSQNDPSIIEPALYLLAVIIPFVPSQILKLKFIDLSTLFIQINKEYHQQAPIIKSLISCYEHLLTAQDLKSWSSNPNIKLIFSSMLSLCLDPRPKVRKRAQESCKYTLSRPPPPSLCHPGSNIFLEAFNQNMSIVFGESTNSNAFNSSTCTHYLQVLEMVLPTLLYQTLTQKTKNKLEILAESLIKLPSTLASSNNMSLIEPIFHILMIIFKNHKDLNFEIEFIKRILESLYDQRPNQNDKTLSLPWIKLICVVTVSLLNPLSNQQVQKPILKVFKKSLSHFCSSTNENVIKCVTLELSLFVINVFESNSFTDSTLLDQLTDQTIACFNNIMYRNAWGGLLEICNSLFQCDSIPITEKILNEIMVFRDDPSYDTIFPFKTEFEETLIQSISSIGFQRFLKLFPLHIEDSESKKRPYLLPLIIKSMDKKPIKTHSLVFYSTELFPCGLRLMASAAEKYKSKKNIEAKVYETIALQMFKILPSLCKCHPFDMKDGLIQLVPLIGPILSSKELLKTDKYPKSYSDLNPIICTSLSELIESVIKDHIDSSNQETLEEVNCIQSYSNKFLSVLCTNYTHVDMNNLQNSLTVDQAKQTVVSKSHTLQIIHENQNKYTGCAIRSFLKLSNPNAVDNYFMSLVKTILQIESSETPIESKAIEIEKNESNETNVVDTNESNQDLYKKLKIYSSLDLILLLVPNLSLITNLQNQTESNEIMGDSSPIKILYQLLTTYLQSQDPTLQKRTYKTLNALVSLFLTLSNQPRDLNVFMSDLCQKLIEPKVLQSTFSCCKKSRIELFGNIVQVSEMVLLVGFIPFIVPEVMLATKESNEKTRVVGFRSLICIAKKLESFDQSQSNGINNEINNEIQNTTIDMNMNEIQKTNMDMNMNEIQNTTIDMNMNEIQKTNMDMNMNEIQKTNMDMDNDNNTETLPPLSFQSFLMMLLAGLAGNTSTMQSSSISCLSNILYEFKNIDKDTINSLLETILCMIQSTQKEVIKSVLGFIKVVVVILPNETLLSQLSLIVNGLLEHAKHPCFRIKIRYIFEKLIKRLGYEVVEQHIPQDDKRMIQYIKKLEKKKTAPKEVKDVLSGDDEEDQEDEDIDLPELFERLSTFKKGVLKESNDDDMIDFLDKSIISKVSNPNQKKPKKQQTFIENKGRIIINESGESDYDKQNDEYKDKEDHYMKAVQGMDEDSFQRLPNGKIKFNKRKLSHQGSDDENEHDPIRKVKDKSFGSQYKAKNAKGDVKKVGQIEPYAYIPIQSKINRKGMADTFKNRMSVKSAKSEKREMVEMKGMRKGNKKHKKHE